MFFSSRSTADGGKIARLAELAELAELLVDTTAATVALTERPP